MPSKPKPGDAPVRTMEEFSLLVGLSRPTVSKFFNDPSALRETTRLRIQAAVDASGFQPNILAANLVRRRSNIVGVIVPDAMDPFYAALSSRVHAIARDAGLHVFVLSSDGDPAQEAHAVGTMASLSIAGAIVAPLGGSREGALEALERMRSAIPLVYVDSPPPHAANFVGTNNRRSFDLIVAHLCANGPPPLFLGMPGVNANAFDRANAYAEAMRARGLESNVLDIPASRDWNFERFGFEAMEMLIASGKAVGATVLCANDRLAFGAISAAWNAGLTVGRDRTCDLRIAGHDDHPLSRYACPPLTTVAQDYDEIGRLAMDILLRRIDDNAQGDRPQEVVLLDARVVVRESA